MHEKNSRQTLFAVKKHNISQLRRFAVDFNLSFNLTDFSTN